MLMGKTSKGRSTSHQLFKDKARNRVDDLQGMFKDLQYAMKESHTGDIALLQERMNQTLSEWKAELNEPSPASSQNEGSLGSFSSDLFRFLVEDDATSALIHPTNQNPYPETNPQINEVGDSWDLEVQDYFVNQAAPSAPDFHEIDQYRGPFLGQHTMVNNLDMSPQLNSHQYNVGHDINPHIFLDTDGSPQCGESVKDLASSLICSIDPPSAYLGEKCALWDCARPAKGLEGCQDYCDRFHADLAKTEGPPGSTPVMRRGGIDLKDGLLFAALIARTKGKDVGIPECEGAATSKSPWNTPELFDLVLEGETIREWLFFDKPRRAFESGSRKQRSLPDYSGRGWHESRKQMVKEFNGLKRSYYMDPQPLHNFELHLYVYENDNNDVCALHRLELKIFDGKKSPKGKASSTALADIQKQNARSTAEFQVDDSQSLKFGEKIRLNGVEYILGAPNQNTPSESSFSGDYSAIQTQQDGQNSFTGYVGSGQYEEDNKHFASGLQPSTCHPSSAFIKLKCALWDCSRPAQGVDYCSILHSTLALSEGTLSNTPVLRPGGISLRDGVLFASLSSKIQGKDVGIPECEGAATMKSPWNAPEHFDIFLFEGETIREWLFFDKPRKAFESGNRKQRSLPDYNGRGWHASRKQVMKEYGGVKKSYYMDPQPMDHAEWHLYEYEIDYTDALTLFRLELKSVDGKKSSKGKAASKDSSIADLQKQMGRLTADSEQSVKHEATRDNSNSPETVNSARKQMSPNVGNYCYGESTGGTGSFS